MSSEERHGLRLGRVQEQRLRAWPKDRIRPKSVALGVISLLAEVDALRHEVVILEGRSQTREWQRDRAEAERDQARAEFAASRAREAALLKLAADFWRPVVRDLEHGILSIDSVRFMAQDFLTALAAHVAAEPSAAPGEGER